MEKKFYLMVLPVIVASFLVGSALTTNTSNQASYTQGTTLTEYVCWDVARADGTVQHQCSHNVLTNNGADHIKLLLGAGKGYGVTAAVNYTALSNMTRIDNANKSSTTLFSEFAAVGLSRAACTYADVAGTGNWSCAKTFTATEAINNLNSSAVFNASANGVMYAAAAFSPVNLSADDQITVTWYFNVTTRE